MASDILGERFGSWVVVSEATRRTTGRFWLCQCDCGERKEIRQADLKNGKSKSCARNGCARKRHLRDQPVRPLARPRAGSFPEYKIWKGMLSRCRNPNAHGWPWYGARGIRVCGRWQSSFWDFLADVGRRPSSDHSIDRIDNDGDYEPGNCRWATISEQMVNRSPNRGKKIEHRGRSLTIRQWAAETGLGPDTIYYRIKSGWPVERALTKPGLQPR